MDEYHTKRYYCHTKKKRLSNGVTKHESVLIAHENVLIAYESGWILHEKGLMKHDNLKNRVFPPWNFHQKLKLPKN